MPVSKKRKKDGKKVQRQATAAEIAEEAARSAVHAAPADLKAGKPKNPFVAHQPQVLRSQRGR